jgi:hypothetical protein
VEAVLLKLEIVPLVKSAGKNSKMTGTGQEKIRIPRKMAEKKSY